MERYHSGTITVSFRYRNGKGKRHRSFTVAVPLNDECHMRHGYGKKAVPFHCRMDGTGTGPARTAPTVTKPVPVHDVHVLYLFGTVGQYDKGIFLRVQFLYRDGT